MRTSASNLAGCQSGRSECSQILVQRVAAGDVAAFDELYVAYHLDVYRYARYLLPYADVAEDVLQETFFAAWRGAGRFRGDTTVKSWLLSIAHHQAMSWWRKQRPVESLDDSGHYERVPDSRDHLAWPNESLRAALDRLTRPHRTVIALTFGLDMSQAEIAQIMQCSIGTVKSRMHYALQQLRRQLVDKESAC